MSDWQFFLVPFQKSWYEDAKEIYQFENDFFVTQSLKIINYDEQKYPPIFKSIINMLFLDKSGIL